MEQVLIRNEISPLEKSRKVSGEIMANLLHLLGSYRQRALGESRGCKYCAFIRKMKLWMLVCSFWGLADGGCKNLSCFGEIKPGGVWGALCLRTFVCQPLILVAYVWGAEVACCPWRTGLWASWAQGNIYLSVWMISRKLKQF